MNRILIVQPEAEAEVVEAAIWYDERAKIVRENFLRAVTAAMRVIEQHPYRYQTIYGRVRRIMVRGFPFALLYVASETEVNVVACFHSSRDPKRWQSRLR